MAAARARGKKLGRQPGYRPKSDRLAPKVLALVELGRSYRLIGRQLGLSKNTVANIVKRSRAGRINHRNAFRDRYWEIRWAPGASLPEAPAPSRPPGQELEGAPIPDLSCA